MPVRAAVYSGQRGAQFRRRQRRAFKLPAPPARLPAVVFRAAAKARVQTAGAAADTARNLHSV